MSLFLDPDELKTLTGHKVTAYRRHEKVRQALGRMGIPFRQRDADGYPLVQRALFEGQPVGPRRGPNFDAVRKTG